ncbi:MAG: PRC-barrel domain-containing protein [Bacteroidales bacterium]|jgi:16S rRNA processing protein RimM|nr:PRC-barrel domain-containing protein [Bacteroidales bacterium]
MINKTDYINIGKLKKRFGKNGEFILGLNSNINIEELPDNNILFLEVNSAELLPVFIEDYSEKPPDDFRIKFEFPFENISMNYYLGKSVFVKKSFFSEDELQITNFDLIGWSVYLSNEKIIAKIYKVLDTKMQTLIVVYINNKEVMIPLHNDFIESIDIQKNIITLNIPAGLIDLN